MYIFMTTVHDMITYICSYDGMHADKQLTPAVSSTFTSPSAPISASCMDNISHTVEWLLSLS